jgi:hypothetical protein
MQHLWQWNHRFFAEQLSRYQSVRYNVHCRTQVQAEVRGYVDKAVTQSPNHLWNAAVFRTKHVNRFLWMFKCR